MFLGFLMKDDTDVHKGKLASPHANLNGGKAKTSLVKAILKVSRYSLT